jgi:hypothetical protein
VATIAIVCPLYAGALCDWWEGFVDQLRQPGRHEHPNYRKLRLETTWYRPFEPVGPFTTPSAVLVNRPCNWGYRVLGRFAETYNGPMSLVEQRALRGRGAAFRREGDRGVSRR